MVLNDEEEVLGEKAAAEGPDGPAHGNSLSSKRPAFLYRLYDAAGKYLKTGVSQNPFKRYTKTFMKNKTMKVITKGSRKEIAALERWIVERDGGPLNREKWANTANITKNRVE